MDIPARPPRPGSARHWASWLERYAGDYSTHGERRGAYRDFLRTLATMQAVFSQPDSVHVAGYLAAHERVADGDADHPGDGELWVPADLSDDDRASWLEGFRSHFEPERLEDLPQIWTQGFATQMKRGGYAVACSRSTRSDLHG